MKFKLREEVWIDMGKDGIQKGLVKMFNSSNGQWKVVPMAPKLNSVWRHESQIFKSKIAVRKAKRFADG